MNHSKPTNTLALDLRQRRILAEFGIPGFISKPWATAEQVTLPKETQNQPNIIQPITANQPLAKLHPISPSVARADKVAITPPNSVLNPPELTQLQQSYTLQCPAGILASTEGDINAQWLFISEMPRRQINHQQNQNCHQLLLKMLRALKISLTQDAFLIKLYPADSATDTAELLQRWLASVIELLPSKIIILLGGQAGKAAFGNDMPTGRKRGETFYLAGKPTIFTYQPELMLMRPQETQQPVRQDLKRARDILANC